MRLAITVNGSPLGGMTWRPPNPRRPFARGPAGELLWTTKPTLRRIKQKTGLSPWQAFMAGLIQPIRYASERRPKGNPSVQAMNKVLNRYGLQALRYKGDIRDLYRRIGWTAKARGVPRPSLRRNRPPVRQTPSQHARVLKQRAAMKATARHENPRGGARPGEVEIYADIERIYATKGRRSAAPGEQFVHNFRHAAAYGRPDGTVVLRGRGGRRLWDHFRA